MIGVSVIGAERVAQRLVKAGGDVKREQERAVGAAALVVQRELRNRMGIATPSHPFFGRMGSDREGYLGARSGQSRRKIVAGRPVRLGSLVTAVVGTGDKHIALLEEGGEITGKQYLRIPLANAQTAQGVDRWTGTSIRDIPGAFLLRTLGGKLFAVRQLSRRDRSGAVVGRNRGLEFLYMLVRKVRIKGRHLFRHARTSAQPEVERLVRGAVTSVVREANRGA